jgi:hypothetical protein
MITVRFPNGCAVQYNTATTAQLDQFGINLQEGTGRTATLIACVPIASGCIIEWHQPCRVYNAVAKQQESDLAKDVRAIRRQLREIKSGRNKLRN